MWKELFGLSMRRNITEGDTSEQWGNQVSHFLGLLTTMTPSVFGIKYYLTDKCFSNNEGSEHTKPRYEDSFNRNIQNALFNLGKTNQEDCLTAFGSGPSSMIKKRVSCITTKDDQQPVYKVEQTSKLTCLFCWVFGNHYFSVYDYLFLNIWSIRIQH